jgi:Fur family zinc uptake transcriptional regulator
MAWASTEEILSKLKESGHKFTGKRQEIVELFVRSGNQYLTARDVYESVKQKYPNISMDTIYRTLTLLQELHVIEQMDHIDGVQKYRLTCQTHHHHHLICVVCGQTSVIEECPMSLLHVKLENFTVVNHRFEIYGYCTSCKN